MPSSRNANRNRGPGEIYNGARDWFYPSLRMTQALEATGHDVNCAWGMSKHGQKMGGVILAEMMR